MAASARTALILCVDDYENILAGWEMLLKGDGYEVLTASGWRRALELFASHPVDEVVLDYQMPEMTGDVLASYMKAIKPNVPVLLVSGDASLAQTKIKSVEAFMLKADVTTLLATVKMLLDSTRRASNAITFPDQSQATPKEQMDDLCSTRPIKAA
jgi:DNA-binding NtrC family response regulator